MSITTDNLKEILERKAQKLDLKNRLAQIQGRSEFPSEPDLTPTPPVSPLPEVSSPPPSVGEALASGISAGFDQTQGMFQYAGAAFADALGMEHLRDSMERQALDNLLEAGRAESEIKRMFKRDPDGVLGVGTEIESVGDAINWAAYNLGSAAVTTLPMIFTGGIGAVVGGAGRKLAAKKVADVARKRLLEQAATSRAKTGAAAGAFAAGSAMGTGEVYGEILNEAGIRAPGLSAGAGLLIGSMESILPVKILDNLGLGRRARQEVLEKVAKSGYGAAAARVGAEVSKSTGIESLTEGAQTVVEKAALAWATENADLFSDPDTWIEVANAAAAGAVGGMGLSVPGAAVREIDTQIQLSQKGKETADRDAAADPIDPLPDRVQDDTETLRPGAPVTLTDARGEEKRGVVKSVAEQGAERYVETTEGEQIKLPVAELTPLDLSTSEVENRRADRIAELAGVEITDEQARELAPQIWDLDESIDALDEESGWEITDGSTSESAGFGTFVDGLPVARLKGQNPMDVPALAPRTRAAVAQEVSRRAETVEQVSKTAAGAVASAPPSTVEPVSTPAAVPQQPAPVSDAERPSGAPSAAVVPEQTGTREPEIVRAEEPAVAAVEEIEEVETAAELKTVAAQTKEEPTPAEIESGDYPQGESKIQGIPFHIETAKGLVRKSKPGEKPYWEVVMPHHYGGITDTEGPDGDPVDIALGPNPKAEPIWVIDQVDPDTKAWDEPKVMTGWSRKERAVRSYERSFSDNRGADRVGAVTRTNAPELKRWLRSSAPKDRSFADWVAGRRRPILPRESAERTQEDEPTVQQALGELDIPELTPEEAHTQGVVRGVRKTTQAKRVKLSPSEQAVVKAYPEYEGLAEEVRQLKANHPTSVWQPLELIGVKKDDETEKLSPQFKQLSYQFHQDKKTGKAFRKDDREKAIRSLTNKVVKDVRQIQKDASEGNTAAKVQLRQALWYENMVRRLREVFGGAGLLYADLLGAFSPNTNVPVNWKFAIDALHRFNRNEFDSILEEFDAWVREGKSVTEWRKAKKPMIVSKTGDLFGMNSPSGQLAFLNLWRVIRGKQAPKARNFAANLIGISRRPTIDVWAARYLQRLAGRKPIPPRIEGAVEGRFSASEEAKKIPAEQRLQKMPVGGEYGFAVEVFTRAAKQLGIEADNLQAIVWFKEKAYWIETLGVDTKEGGSFEEELNNQPLRRLLSGVSIARSNVPTAKELEAEMNIMEQELFDASPQSEKILAYKFRPTYGFYGGEGEVSFDAELTVDEDYQDAEFVRAIARLGKRANQDDVFVSRVLRSEDRSANSRPGFEIYFSSARELDAVRPLLDQIVANGADGFTLSTETKWIPQSGRADLPGKFQGIRLQIVPEIAARFDPEVLEILKQGSDAVRQWMDQQSDKFDAILNQVASLSDVIYAEAMEYDTLVIGREQYDEYTDYGGADSRATEETSRPAWFGQSIGEIARRRAAALEGAQADSTDGGGGPGTEAESNVQIGASTEEVYLDTYTKLFNENTTGFDHTQWRAQPSPGFAIRHSGLRARRFNRRERPATAPEWQQITAALEDVISRGIPEGVLSRVRGIAVATTDSDAAAHFAPATQNIFLSENLLRLAADGDPVFRTVLVTSIAHELTHAMDYTAPGNRSWLTTSGAFALGDSIRPAEETEPAEFIEDMSPVLYSLTSTLDAERKGSGLKRFLGYPLSRANMLKGQVPMERFATHAYLRYELFAQMMALHIVAPDITARIAPEVVEVLDHGLEDYRENGNLEATRLFGDELTDAGRQESDRARNQVARGNFRDAHSVSPPVVAPMARLGGQSAAARVRENRLRRSLGVDTVEAGAPIERGTLPHWTQVQYDQILQASYQWKERGLGRYYLRKLLEALPDPHFLDWTYIPETLRRRGSQSLTLDAVQGMLINHQLIVQDPFVIEGVLDPEDPRVQGAEYLPTAQGYHELQVRTPDGDIATAYGTVQTTETGHKVLFLDDVDNWQAVRDAGALVRRLVEYARSAGLDGIAWRAEHDLAAGMTLMGLTQESVDAPVSDLGPRAVREGWTQVTRPRQRGERETLEQQQKDNRTAIARDIEEIGRRLTGGRARLELVPAIETKEARETYGNPDALARMGYEVDPAGPVIRVAMDDSQFDPYSSVLEASWLWLTRPEAEFLTQEERASLTTEHERLSKMVVRGLGMSEEAVADLPSQIVQAKAFALWNQERRDKQRSRTLLSRQVGFVFAKIRKFYLQVKSALLRRNFRGVDEVFNAIGYGLVTQPAPFRELRRDVLSRIGAGSASLDLQLYASEASEREFWRGFRKNPAKWRALFDRARRWIQDERLPFLRRQQLFEAQTGRALTEDEDFYMHASLYPGRVGDRVEHLQDMKERLIEAIAKAGVDFDDFEDYLYARHAPERNKRIAQINPQIPEGGSGMSDAEAAAVLTRIERMGQSDVMAQLETMVRDIANFDIRNRLETGLIDVRQARALQAYSHYIPLKGWEEIEPATGDFLVAEQRREALTQMRGRGGSGYNVAGPEYRRAAGRGSRAGNLVGHLLVQAEEGIQRGEKNRTLTKLLAQVRAFHSEVEQGEQLFSLQRTRQIPVFNTSTGLLHYRTETRLEPEIEDRTVRLKENGEEVRITIHGDPRLAEGLRNLEITKMSGFVRALGTYTRWISYANTTLNPEFLVTNFSRDLIGSNITARQYNIEGLSREIFTTAVKVHKTVRAAYRFARKKPKPGEESPLREYSDLMERYSVAGGRVYFYRFKDLNDTVAEHERNLKALMEPFSSRAGLFTKLKTLADVIESSNIAVDNALRLATFKALTERGWSDAKAAQAARNITVDFNKRGILSPTLNAFYVFTNASIQGTAVVFRAAASRPVQKMLAGIVVGGFLLDWFNSILSPEDDDGEKIYDKLAAWELENNMILLNPWGDAKDPYVTIPLPYGYSFFWNFGRSTAALARGARDGWETVRTNLAALTTSFSPIPIAPVPTIIQPIYEAIQNENYFGGPITPTQFPGDSTPDSQRYFGHPSEWTKAITETLNKIGGGDVFRKAEIEPLDISPNTIEHFIDYNLGAAGTFYTRVSRILGEVLGFDRFREDQTLRGTDLPFVRRVARTYRPVINRSLFYTRYYEITAAESEIKDLEEAATTIKRPELLAIAQERRIQYEPLTNLLPLAKSMRKQLRRIRNQRLELRQSYYDRKEIDREEFYRQVDALNLEEKGFIDQFNRRYFETVREPNLYQPPSVFRPAGAAEMQLYDALRSESREDLSAALNGPAGELTITQMAQIARVAEQPTLGQILDTAAPGASLWALTALENGDPLPASLAQ